MLISPRVHPTVADTPSQKRTSGTGARYAATVRPARKATYARLSQTVSTYSPLRLLMNLSRAISPSTPSRTDAKWNSALPSTSIG